MARIIQYSACLVAVISTEIVMLQQPDRNFFGETLLLSRNCGNEGTENMV
jgi:hypothetical protein